MRGTLQVTATNTDGTHIIATITYDPATGTLTGASVDNQSPNATSLLINTPSGLRNVPVAAGSRTFTVQQLAAVGLHSLSDISNFSVATSIA